MHEAEAALSGLAVMRRLRLVVVVDGAPWLSMIETAVRLMGGWGICGRLSPLLLQSLMMMNPWSSVCLFVVIPK